MAMKLSKFTASRLSDVLADVVWEESLQNWAMKKFEVLSDRYRWEFKCEDEELYVTLDCSFKRAEKALSEWSMKHFAYALAGPVLQRGLFLLEEHLGVLEPTDPSEAS